MHTVLITGSEGNIGTYIVRRFREKWPSVHLVRTDLKRRNVEPLGKDKFFQGNLRDPEFAKKIFAENQIDYVIHAAARLYGIAGFNKDVYGLYANDIECLLNVLDNSGAVKKFVYLSSSMVYESSEKVPFTEEITEEIMPPKSSYGLTKFFGEKAVKFFNQQHGVTYTIWRPFNAVSPLEPHNREGAHVFVDFYRRLFVDRQQKIEIYGSGGQVRCFTWVEEIANAIADFLTDSHTNGQTFNIGNNEPKTMIELKDMLIAIGKERALLPQNYNPETIIGSQFFGIDVQLRIPSVEKIKRILNWECQVDFKTCFEKFVDYKTDYAND